MSVFLKWVLALACITLGSADAWAQAVETVHLKITLNTGKSRKPAAEAKGRPKRDPAAEWKTACEQVGAAMTAQKGPWGFGVFTSFSCHRGKDLVSGTDQPGAWTLTLVDGAKEVTWTLARQRQVLAKLAMPPSVSTLSFYVDDEFVDLTAFTLLSSLPIGGRLNAATLKGSPARFTGHHWRAGRSRGFKYQVPQPPTELTIYRLRWDAAAKAWRSDVAGTARRTRIVEPKSRTKDKKKLLVGGVVEYETSDEIPAEGTFWFHDAAGPGARQKELVAAVREAQIALDAAAKSGQLADFLSEGGSGLVTNLLQTAASGYVGLRYGLQVLPSEGELGKLLGKTSKFSLLAEVRGGPLKGLRYYYDKLPETKANLEHQDGSDVQAKIAFSRHTLGFSMGFAPGFLVDRITVDPKLGMWEFKAKLPTEQDADGKVVRDASFDLGRTFSLAAEVGVEMLSDWYTLRGWYAIDTGFSVVKTGGSVTSNRLGIDAYFTAGPVIPMFGVPFKTALLAFYVYEAVSLESSEVEDPLPGQDAISGIDYSTGYAGGGVAISW